MPDPLYIGLDAGASKTELLLAADQHDELLTLKGPSANLQRLGLDAAAHVLADLVGQALSRYPDAPVGAVCAGAAGAGRTRDQEALVAAIRAELGARTPPHVVVVHDAHIAIEAAFEGDSGIMVIAGTGSVALARTTAGHFERVGGWGYLLGDEGSGHAVGLAGLRAVAAAHDGGPATCLQEMLAQRYGITPPDELIHAVYQGGWPVQHMAPLVVEAAREGDAVALHILREQTRLLARQVHWLARRCTDLKPQVALLGGLTNEPYYHDTLREALQEALPGWTIQRPLHRPVIGAWRLARQAAQAGA